mmetsp:Transcript_14943/g.47642  ORF Transcript_14943/g.47642 Transcript_14943/m.47642 type:complete len:210 (-) Transcript_14943:613-1242(-)
MPTQASSAVRHRRMMLTALAPHHQVPPLHPFASKASAPRLGAPTRLARQRGAHPAAPSTWTQPLLQTAAVLLHQSKGHAPPAAWAMHRTRAAFCTFPLQPASAWCQDSTPPAPRGGSRRSDPTVAEAECEAQCQPGAPRATLSSRGLHTHGRTLRRQREAGPTCTPAGPAPATLHPQGSDAPPRGASRGMRTAPPARHPASDPSPQRDT